jgi:HK97 family phage major capsid protein
LLAEFNRILPVGIRRLSRLTPKTQLETPSHALWRKQRGCDMPTVKDLREQRNKLATSIRSMADKLTAEKREFSPEEQENWRQLNTDFDAFMGTPEKPGPLAIAERAEAIDAEMRSTSPADREIGRDDVDGRSNPHGEIRTNPENDLRLALGHWALERSKPSLVTDEHRAASRRLRVHPGDNEFIIPLGADTSRFSRAQDIYRTKRQDIAHREVRALSTQSGQDGGFTIAPIFNAGIESALLYFGPMIQIATPIRTSTAADYPMMTDNETSKTGSYVGENTAITTTEKVTINQVVFHAYKATTNAILVPYELLRDTAIDLRSYLSGKLGERLGRFINTEATTGSVKCKGIVTAASTGVSAASATAITYDDVLGLIHSVDKAYRDMPGAGVMCHDNIVLALRKLKSGTGEYLWTDGTQAGQPDRIAGKPLFVNNDMASSMSSSAVSVLFGDLSKYHIRTVGEIRLTMTDQLYWASDQTGFAAYMYFDGNIVDAGTHPIKKLTH